MNRSGVLLDWRLMVELAVDRSLCREARAWARVWAARLSTVLKGDP